MNYGISNVLIFLLLFVCQSVAAADFYSEKKLGDGCWGKGFTINGEIIPGDEKKLSGIFSALQKENPGEACKGLSFRLISNGGDVDTAIKMGEIFRAWEVEAIVPYRAVCASSCVFLLVGAVDRVIVGSVGIHRPYFEKLSPSVTTADIRRRLDLNNGRIRDYLLRMDVPISLLDAMLSVPPQSMKVLTEDELQAYRLDQKDPAHDERETAKMAYIYGLSSSVYRFRLARVTENCAKFLMGKMDLLRHDGCKYSYVYDLPEKEAFRHAERVGRLCDVPGRSNKDYIDCQHRENSKIQARR
jgi:hypothetical protein